VVIGAFAKARGSFLFEDLIELGIFIALPRRQPGLPLREFLEEFVFCVSRFGIAQEPPPSFQIRSRQVAFLRDHLTLTARQAEVGRKFEVLRNERRNRLGVELPAQCIGIEISNHGSRNARWTDVPSRLEDGARLIGTDPCLVEGFVPCILKGGGKNLRGEHAVFRQLFGEYGVISVGCLAQQSQRDRRIVSRRAS
jgi:hypothetical protein